MSLNLGLDFGTTYTIASVIDCLADNKAIVKSVRINGNHLIDSIALVAGDTIEYGRDARVFLASDYQSYRGFKMLIGDKTEELRAKKKYTAEITPEIITKGFIKYVIDSVNVELNNADKIINNLVIGVPASWVNKKETIDCNLILKNLIREIEGITVNNIEVVSEPTLACAYFSHLYKQKFNKDFQGKMILIDYGGGTLDLSLCDVKGNGTNSVVTEIETIGEGWNTQGDVGKAGLAFMEEVTKIVLLENGFKPEEFETPAFNKAVADVEEQIINKTGKIEFFVTSGTDEDSPRYDADLKPNMRIFYKGKSISVKIKHLRKAYDAKIKHTLENKLKEFDAVCAKHYVETSVSNTNNEPVKIILVGGFNAFSMTKQTIFKHYNYGKKGDIRFELLDSATDSNQDVSAAEKSLESKQCAISFGAALISNSIVGFDRTVPYHLGIMIMEQGTAEYKARYAIDKYMKADNKVHWAHAKGSNKPAFFTGISIYLFYNLEDEQKEKIFTYNKGLDVYEDSLDLVKYSEKGVTCFNIGLSIDKYLTITLHIRGMDNHFNTIIEDDSIVLDTIDKVIGTAFEIKM